MTSAVIALAGSPNCGKTALFNTLTGSKQKVANYAGVTVEKKFATLRTTSGKQLAVVDLPGTYSLSPQTPDEQVTLDVLLNRNAEQTAPDAIVAVADATNLNRTLSLALELKELGTPVLLSINMIDLAKRRGLEIDLASLEKELGIPVVATIAIKRSGTRDLLKLIEKTVENLPFKNSDSRWTKPTTEDVEKRFAEIDRIVAAATKKSLTPDYVSAKIDQVVLHPILGSAILLATMFLIFQAVFTWAGPPADFIEGSIGSLGEWVSGALPEGWLQSLVVDGIIAGVGAVVVFLPQILFLFFFILVLEGTGYMARAAFLMDKLMSKVGLHGRAFIPLLSSFACAIPGIMATRAIKNPKDRLITILVAPLMTCSARLPVYVLLISAFIPNEQVLGPFGLQGVVMFSLFVGGIIAAVGMAYLLKKTILSGPKPPFVLELPTYKLPSMVNVWRGMKMRAGLFLKRAGSIIFVLSILLWVMSTYPKAPADADQPAINYSVTGIVGHAIEPIFKPLGFDWRISTGLIPGFAAREVMVGALGTVFAIEAESEEETEKALSDKIQAVWGIPTALALLVWYIFSPQCISTIAVAKRETNSWRWPLFMFAYMLALAYVFAWITFRTASAFLA